jgi:hypothetical protein
MPEPKPERYWRSYGDDPLPAGAEAMGEPFAAFSSATALMAGRIASSRSVPERAGRCLIRMLPALQCFVKRRTMGMRDCGW